MVSARPAAAEATFEELREEFGKALGRVGGYGGAPAGLTVADGAQRASMGLIRDLPQVPLPHAAPVLQVHAELLALHRCRP